MKILHVLSQRPGRTGSGIFLQSLISEAAGKKHEQAVIIGIPQNEEINFPENIYVFPVLFETSELPFPVVGMSDEMPYKSTRYRDMTEIMIHKWKTAFKTQLEKAVTIFKPDIVLSHHLWILSSLIKEIFPQLPLFVITHGTGMRQLELAPQFSEYVRVKSRKIDLIFALSSLQKSMIMKKYGLPSDKIVITGSGYNSKIFYSKEKLQRETVKIVYAGKLSRAKGVHSLLNVFSELPEQNIEIIMIGAANKDEKNLILELAEKIKPPIKFTGNLPQTELSEIFRNSDIFVLPSFFEGLPLVVIEAIACGMRIVVSDLPGIREFIGDALCASRIVEFVPLPRFINVDMPHPDDLPAFEDDLKSSICRHVAKTRQKNNIYCQEIHTFVSKWTWQELFNRIEAEINQILRSEVIRC